MNENTYDDENEKYIIDSETKGSETLDLDGKE